jgi:hypothetical protein
MMTKLSTPRSPALPLAQTEPSPQYTNRYSNILRLYFNQLDAAWQGVLGTNGSQYLQTPHIAASANADQIASGDDVPTLVSWDAVESISGFTLDPGGYAIADQDGVYKIDYSLQLANTDNASHDAFVWLQVNGDLVSGSSSRFTVPARKSAGVFGFIVAYSSIEFEIAKDDEIRLWWATEKAYNPVGPVAGVYMENLPAQTLPYPRPSNPSAVGSINYVSRLP